MSSPTRAIVPLMLEDFRKVAVDHRGESGMFTSNDITTCMNKVSTVELHQVVTVGKDIRVTAYYAGHVLGAVMFYVEVNGYSVVYTGDYNMASDRHLGAAWIERLNPHVVISESTYATKFRELRMKREKEFLQEVIQTVDKGGKVLVPVFALGRAQELCILLDSHWERTNMSVPLHFAGALTAKANAFYKMFVTWCNDHIQKLFLQRNVFDFQHVTPFDRGTIRDKNPMVLFATPGMLHGGLSLSVLKEWCGDAKNTVIIPGYCVQGTIGHVLLRGKAKTITIDKVDYPVRCKVISLSFSAHTDHRGILQLINWLKPKSVVLVHGEEDRMLSLKADIESNLDLPTWCPANHETITIPATPPSELEMTQELHDANLSQHFSNFADQFFKQEP